MDRKKSGILRLVSRVRTVAAWLVILAFVSMFVADYKVRWHHVGPWPPNIPMPSELELFLLWRNVSLLVLVFLILLSIPRWQSLVGIGGLVIFFFLFGRV